MSWAPTMTWSAAVDSGDHAGPVVEVIDPDAAAPNVTIWRANPPPATSVPLPSRTGIVVVNVA